MFHMHTYSLWLDVYASPVENSSFSIFIRKNHVSFWERFCFPTFTNPALEQQVSLLKIPTSYAVAHSWVATLEETFLAFGKSGQGIQH